MVKLSELWREGRVKVYLYGLWPKWYRLLRGIDRVLVAGSWSQLGLLVVLMGAAVCMFAGAGEFFEVSPSSMWRSGNGDSLWWSIVCHFMDAGNQHAVAPDARPFALSVTIAGLIFISAIVSVITNVMERHAERYRKGTVYYGYRDHVVIFGANDVLPGLLRQLCGDGRYRDADMVVLASGDVDLLRMRILSDMPKEVRARVEFHFGRRDSKESMARMRVGRARCIFILGEDDEVRDSGECAESYHDALNMECLRLVADALPDGKNPVPCHVMFEYQTMFSVFQFSNLSDSICRKIDFKPFNFYEMWAQRVLVGKPGDSGALRFAPLDGGGIRYGSEKHVHLIVVGMSKAGIALAIEAAHVAHYPNFTRDPQRCRTRITFIDRAADEEMNFFKGRFADMFDVARWRYADAADFGDSPLYGVFSAGDPTWHDPLHGVNAASPYSAEWLGDEVVDIDWEFIRGSVESPAVKDYLRDAAADGSSLVTVAVCFMQTHRAVAAALYLPAEVYEHAERILVNQPYNSAVVDNVSNYAGSACARYRNLRPFGMRSECFDMSLVDDRAARMLNYVYETDDRAFAETTANAAEINRRWRNCSVANRWSNVYGVNSLWTKLRSAGGDWWRLREECMAQTEHDRWCTEKLLMGFRPVTREEQTYCMVSKANKNELKKRRIHLDICSCERLKAVDPSAVGTDEVLISALQNIFCPDERIRKLYEEL